MKKTEIKNAIKNDDNSVLKEFAQEEFIAKFGNCKNTWFKNFEIVNEHIIKVLYGFHSSSSKTGELINEMTGNFIVEL